jgi:hypothetical protein
MDVKNEHWCSYQLMVTTGKRTRYRVNRIALSFKLLFSKVICDSHVTVGGIAGAIAYLVPSRGTRETLGWIVMASSLSFSLEEEKKKKSETSEHMDLDLCGKNWRKVAKVVLLEQHSCEWWHSKPAPGLSSLLR